MGKEQCQLKQILNSYRKLKWKFKWLEIQKIHETGRKKILPAKEHKQKGKRKETAQIKWLSNAQFSAYLPQLFHYN